MSTALGVRPVSHSTAGLRTDSDPTLTVPATLPESGWEAIAPSPDRPAVAYLSTRDSTNRLVTVGGAQSFRVTAHDRFGTPVADADLSVTATGGGGSWFGLDTDGSPYGVTTNEAGIAAFGYTPNVAAGTTTDVRHGGESVRYDIGTAGMMALSSNNQLFDVGEVEPLRVSEARPVTLTENPCLLGLDLLGPTCGEETFDYAGLDTIIGDGDGETYRVRMQLADFDRDGEFNGGGVLGPDDVKRVVITKDRTEAFDAELTHPAARDMLDSEGGVTALLEPSSYQGSPDLDEVNIDDGELIVNEILGRMNLETDED